VQLGALRDADAEGFVTIDVNGEGTIARPQMSVDVELDEFGWERYRDIVLVLDADVTTERVEVNELSLEWDADDILSASGTIPAPFDAVFGDGELGALPIDFTAELQPLPLRKFSAIDYTFASLRGQVGGYVALGGTLREPRIDGRFSAIDIEVSDRTRGTIATEVSYAEGEANADLIVCSGPREMLLGSATVPVPLDFVKIASGEPIEVAGDIQGTLKGERVHLARLLPRKIFDEYVSSLGGMMAVDLTVDGTVEQPTLDGTLRVTDGEVFIGEFARAFEDIKVDLQASPGELELRDFYVGDRNGYVDAKGTLQVDGIKPGRVDARVSLDQFGTSGFTDFPTFITANIDVGGDFSGNGARAEARVADLEVVVPDTSTRETYPTQLDADIVVLREGRRSEMEDIFEIDGFDGATREKIADLRVIVERDSWVRHPQGQVEVMGDITVEVIGTTVRLGGEIETVRGSAEVLGKRFDIAKGLITFTGADPPDPRLQVEAVYEFDRSITRAIGRPTSGEPRAIVRVTGRTSNPQIRFLSDPQMPESDVIYALITGQPPNQQEVGQTQGGGLAAGVASGLAAGLLEDKLGEILPVKFDVFRLEAGDEGFADPSVEVGKYIFEDVFFSIEYKIGAEPNENTSEFNIEYRFLPRWIFEFTAGNLGTGEANIFWEIF
jgi:translocation and assembly module TamB